MTPDVVTYTTGMKACARSGREGKVRELFRAAKDLVSMDGARRGEARARRARRGPWREDHGRSGASRTRCMLFRAFLGARPSGAGSRIKVIGRGRRGGGEGGALCTFG